VATYAVGDIQGCYEPFRRLLDRIAFEPTRDRLWLVGDLVNRGPRSLDVLRWAREHDDCVTCVLGNHDLHLLARASGHRGGKKGDTLDEILAAPRRDELLDWLRGRPLLHREDTTVLVHAGLLPAWTVDHAQALAHELEAALQGPDHRRTLGAIYSRGSTGWRDDLAPPARWRTLAAVFTRLRTIGPDGRASYDFAGPPDEAPAGARPWFVMPGRRSADHTVVFGHWAALGLHLAPGVVGLDSGCVWGGALSAVRLPDLAVFQEPATGE
jgi:bis(5'-nucleosyl)-tetraphosphatase (symmetrical)